MARRVKKSKVVAPNLSDQTDEREIVHPKPIVKLLVGKTALTAKRAKQLMGWIEEKDKVNFGKDFLLVDRQGKKVRCLNNVNNRPIYKSVYLTLMQEILRGRWQLNMENRIIGITGLILNGQHTFIGLILAVQEWEENPDKYPFWKTEPTIDTSIGYGIPEADNIINTMDTCKPRSLADVIYRSAFFSNLNNQQRKAAARATDYAVRLLWHRTDAGIDAFGLRRTHAESLDFIERHPKILECVSHILEEEGKEKQISRYLSPGYSSALLYLMGCSNSDPTEYTEAENPSESLLDWKHWEKACDFWVLLAQKADEVSAVATELANIIDEDGGTNLERQALVAKAWNLYVEGKPVTVKRIAINYAVDEDGLKVLDGLPNVGGIDLGELEKTDEEDITQPDPSPKEITKRSATAIVKTQVGKLGRPKQAKKGSWTKGDVAWVSEAGDTYLGKLITNPVEGEDNEVRVDLRDAQGDEWEVSCSCLSLKQPKPETEEEEENEEPQMAVPHKRAKSKKGKGKKNWKALPGKTCWVDNGEEEPWQGKLIDLLGKNAKLKVLQGHEGAGNTRAALVEHLRETQPTKG